MIDRTRDAQQRRHPARWFAILLILLALGDLRTEVQLLSDQFTVTGLGYAIRHHQLAVVVLMGSPSLWRRYG
ncbi:hypothetical protein KR52_10670 [Synechococcus sp. KORDI-52]|uniref:hypothetical protein n=1 Tax=Synechococcus sp. KORDI-52 TaxID=585425 RepID=UPI0004E093F8|nr:hypothetical protein [Synechococcus sp. KORDI-52]AII49603.1 hypothetical protein KR52_10670 [Synechococcus sp. KORDI-52]